MLILNNIIGAKWTLFPSTVAYMYICIIYLRNICVAPPMRCTLIRIEKSIKKTNAPMGSTILIKANKQLFFLN